MAEFVDDGPEHDHPEHDQQRPRRVQGVEERGEQLMGRVQPNFGKDSETDHRQQQRRPEEHLQHSRDRLDRAGPEHLHARGQRERRERRPRPRALDRHRRLGRRPCNEPGRDELPRDQVHDVVGAHGPLARRRHPVRDLRRRPLAVQALEQPVKELCQLHIAAVAHDQPLALGEPAPLELARQTDTARQRRTLQLERRHIALQRDLRSAVRRERWGRGQRGAAARPAPVTGLLADRAGELVRRRDRVQELRKTCRSASPAVANAPPRRRTSSGTGSRRFASRRRRAEPRCLSGSSAEGAAVRTRASRTRPRRSPR
jgi:hypothetical protein